MKKKVSFNIKETINESIKTKTKLLSQSVADIELCGRKLAEVSGSGGKILLCGNGGSAADAQHIAAELIIRFRSQVHRPSIPALALSVDPSIMTAGGNDIGFDNVFARCVEGYGKEGDALIGISTSGNSENVFRAIQTAKQQNMITFGLLGSGGGKILPECDYSVVVDSKVTARIQESHILIGHIWCEMIEDILFEGILNKKNLKK